MKRFIICLSAALAVLVAAFTAIIATLNSTDWSEYEEPIAQAVADATGRRVTFGGEVSVNIGLSPAIVANGISFQNAVWGSAPDMLVLDRLGIRLKLLPLIFGEVEINKVEIIGLHVLLETDAEGNGNWDFISTENGIEAPETEAPDPGSALLRSAFLQAALIQDVTLTYNDGISGTKQQFRVDRLKASMATPDSPLKLMLDARYQDQAIELNGVFAGVADAPGGGPLGLDLELFLLDARIKVDGTVAKPLDTEGIDIAIQARGDSLARIAEFAGTALPDLGAFDVAAHIAGDAQTFSVTDLKVLLDVAGASISIEGAIQDPVNASGADLTLQVSGQSLPALSQLAGSELPDVGPFSLTAAIAGSVESIDVRDLLVALGQTKLTGQISAKIAATPPEIEATIAAPFINLVQLGLVDESAPETAAPASGDESGDQGDTRLFPDDPLPVEQLTALDAVRGRVVLSVGELVVDSQTVVNNLRVGVDLKPRELRIDPLRVTYSEAVVDGRVSLGISGKLAALDAQMAIAHPDLGRFLQAMDTESLSEGPVDITLDITGRGASVAEIMASLSGKFVLAMGAAKLHEAWAQRAMTNVVDVVVKRGDTAPVDLNCITADFDINSGVAESASVVINTPTLSLFGKGHIDLRDETLRFRFDRLATGISASGALPPFKVAGTLASPSGGVDASALGNKLVGFGASLISRGGQRSEVTAANGPLRCEQMLVVYNEVLENRSSAKSNTVVAAGKATDATKAVTKNAFGKVKGLFKRKKD